MRWWRTALTHCKRRGSTTSQKTMLLTLQIKIKEFNPNRTDSCRNQNFDNTLDNVILWHRNYSVIKYDHSIWAHLSNPERHHLVWWYCEVCDVSSPELTFSYLSKTRNTRLRIHSRVWDVLNFYACFYAYFNIYHCTIFLNLFFPPA